MELKKKERINSLDVIRTIAVLAVVMIHVSAMFVVNTEGNVEIFLIGNIFDSISRIGVPLFVMVSGALMLDENKQITLKQIIFKYLLNIIILFLVWSIFYSIFNNVLIPFVKKETINIKSVIISIFNGNYHMWYLFMIVGLYLITPILRLFVKKENSGIILWFVFLSLFFQFLVPVIDFLANLNTAFTFIHTLLDKIDLDFVGGFTTYYLLGWYIAHVGFNKKAQTCLYIMGGISIVATIIATQIFPTQYGNTYSNMNILILLYSVAVFLLIFNTYKKGTKLDIFFENTSSLAFGVYIIHPFLLSVYGFIFPQEYTLGYLLLEWLIVTLFSFGITFLITKIPFIKKIVRG